MNNRFYIATISSDHREIIDTYGFGAELDQFCTAENMEGEKLAICEAEITALKELYPTAQCEQIPVKAPPFILHAPFNELFPAAIDPDARALALKRFRQAAELARKHGAAKMVVHSGYVPLVYYKEWHVDRSVEFWQEFMESQPKDFHIVIENVIDDEPYMLAKIVERVQHPGVKACFDVGHAACVSPLPTSAWLEVLGPHLGHLHIHNNDGSHDWHKPVMEGIADMEQVMQFLAKPGREDITVTIESLETAGSVAWLIERGFLSPRDNRT